MAGREPHGMTEGYRAETETATVRERAALSVSRGVIAGLECPSSSDKMIFPGLNYKPRTSLPNQASSCRSGTGNTPGAKTESF